MKRSKQGFATRAAMQRYQQKRMMLLGWVFGCLFFLGVICYSSWDSLFFKEQVTDAQGMSNFLNSKSSTAELQGSTYRRCPMQLVQTTYSQQIIVLGGMTGGATDLTEHKFYYDVYEILFNNQAAALLKVPQNHYLPPSNTLTVSKVDSSLQKQLGGSLPLLQLEESKPLYTQLFLIGLIGVLVAIWWMLGNSHALRRRSALGKCAAQYGDPDVFFEIADLQEAMAYYRDDRILLAPFGLCCIDPPLCVPMQAILGAHCEQLETYSDGKTMMQLIVETTQGQISFQVLGEKTAWQIVDLLCSPQK